MEEISTNEFTERAEYLVKEWQNSKIRGFDLSVDTAFAAFHYIPYILATFYYSWMNYRVWSNHKAENEKKKINLWINESIDKILQLAPRDEIDDENCREDMKKLIMTITEEIDRKNLTLASEILSTKIFEILQKYYPAAENREKDLIRYISNAELERLINTP